MKEKLSLSPGSVAEDLVRANTELYQIFNATAPLCVIEENCVVTRVNEAFTSFFGISREEALRTKCHDIWKGRFCHTDDCILVRILNGEARCEYEVQTETSDGTKRSCIVTALPYRSAEGKVIGLVESFVDITGRKEAEERQKLTSHVLELLNRSSEKTDRILEILELIEGFTGFDSIGLRLREGDDYPYYKTIGFPEDFVEEERFLCETGSNGEPVRDAGGNPVLDCLCGCVLRSKADPSLSCYTEYGSFWTNSISELFASLPEENLPERPRNRCGDRGYESVALIPLRSDNETIGLLQLNDKRKGMFTYEMIRFFEKLGASIGIAFERKHTRREILKAIENEQRRIGQDLHDGLVQHLSGIGFMSQLLERHLKAKNLKEAEEAAELTKLVNQSVAQARHLARGLFPLGLKKDGIVSVMEELTDYVEGLYEVPCVFKAKSTSRKKGKTPGKSLDREAQTHLYRIAQEAISNAIKHGSPSRVEVSLEETDDKIVFEIRDDGKGLPESLMDNKGMGLRSMRYRASMIGGTLEIRRASKNKGTIVTCTLKQPKKGGKRV